MRRGAGVVIAVIARMRQHDLDVTILLDHGDGVPVSGPVEEERERGRQQCRSRRELSSCDRDREDDGHLSQAERLRRSPSHALSVPNALERATTQAGPGSRGGRRLTP